MSKEIKELVEKSINSVPDSKLDNEIIHFLKPMNKTEVLEIVKEMVNSKSPNVFYIARKVLNERKVAEPFFVFGLTKADAGTIKLWLEFALPSIGIRRIIKALKESEKENPEIVDKALYWLPSLVEDKDLNLVKELKRWWK